MKKFIEIYLEQLNIYESSKFIKKIKYNKITVLLGLRLPGMIISKLQFRKYVNDKLKDKFFSCEKGFKKLELEEENEIEFYNKMNDLKHKIKNIQKDMETEIKKNEIFQKLIEYGKDYQEDNRQFCDWLLEDYYLLFLSDNLNNIKNSFYDLEDYKNVLKKMLELRFDLNKDDEEPEPIKIIAMKIVWLESYSDYIIIILNIYQKISLKEKIYL